MKQSENLEKKNMFVLVAFVILLSLAPASSNARVKRFFKEASSLHRNTPSMCHAEHLGCVGERLSTLKAMGWKLDSKTHGQNRKPSEAPCPCTATQSNCSRQSYRSLSD